MSRYSAVIALIVLAPAVWAQSGIQTMDKHVFVALVIDELELTDTAGEHDIVWDKDLWVGGDLHKFWFKSEGNRGDGERDRTEMQFLYSKAVLPFWDLQAGIRKDADAIGDRDWATVALTGLAPYFFDVEIEAFFAEGGQTSIRATAEYELLLTQRLILMPQLEFTAYGRDEAARLIGAGPSQMELGLRLRYEFKREFAPYLGLVMHRHLGQTSDFRSNLGLETRDISIRLGLRGWF